MVSQSNGYGVAEGGALKVMALTCERMTVMVLQRNGYSVIVLESNGYAV
jgi:hypothetical protein